MWLQNNKYETMRKVSGFTEDDLQALRLPIRLPDRAAVSLYHKIAIVCKELQKNRLFFVIVYFIFIYSCVHCVLITCMYVCMYIYGIFVGCCHTGNF